MNHPRLPEMILACIADRQAVEVSRVLNQCAQVANEEGA
jgi:hypothetical protein